MNNTKIKNNRFLASPIVTGTLLGVVGVILVCLGNPINSGFCVSCFMEHIAGALHLHSIERMSYLRPEILGFILGSFLCAYLTGTFKPKSGISLPLVRLLMGIYIMIGAGLFIGCPIKAAFRLGAGDLTAIAGILGFIAGVWVGLGFIKNRFTLERKREAHPIDAFLLPLLIIFLILAYGIKAHFLITGTYGPAAMHAPFLIALIVSVGIGFSAQRSTFCMMAGVRNFLMSKDTLLLSGILSLLVSSLVMCLALGYFKLGMFGQPGSHLAHGWSFGGMFLVGALSTFANGCPFRQLIMAGEGNIDAGITVIGMLIGAGIVHNWLLRSTLAGPTFQGEIALLTGIIFILILGITFRER
ncbi:MAG: YedE family putative selenium transporter [bacterium]